MTGALVEVTPDAARRPITRTEFVEALHDSGRHGFTGKNRSEGTAYYVHDTRSVRFITLDTVCAAGGADGSGDAPQRYWLGGGLEKGRPAFRARGGPPRRPPPAPPPGGVRSPHGCHTRAAPRAPQSRVR